MRLHEIYLSHVPFPLSVVHVHIGHVTPRARHAVRQVLCDMLGWEVRFVDDSEAFAATTGLKLAYSKDPFPRALHILPHGWLDQSTMDPIDPALAIINEHPCLFPVDGGDLLFDPFAASFFLLSRFEEWSPMPKDEHGRPVTKALHAARHGYLDRPVVDEWALQLAARWREVDPGAPDPQRAYKQAITVDLDNGLKYGGRPMWRSFGSCVRDLLKGQWSDVKERVDVLRGIAPDPFLIDDELKARFRSGSDEVKFFVLAAARGTWDHAVPVGHPAYAKALRDLTSWAIVGLHPSYFSSEREGLTARERNALQHVIGKDITATRQHFLRLRVPDTLRELETLGIKEEHSFGVHDRLGFRCGTCTPYRWYDLQQERSTELMIHPFTVMDNTLRDKLGLSPEEAVQRVRSMIAAVKRVNGTFTGLWHESFLARTGKHSAWRAAILRIIEGARA